MLQKFIIFLSIDLSMSGCMHYLNRISEAIWPLNLFLNLVNQNMFASTGRKFWLLTYSVLGMFVYVLIPHMKILEHNLWVFDTLCWIPLSIFHLNIKTKLFWNNSKNVFTLITVQCTVVKLIFQASVHTVVHGASGPITYFYLNVVALLEFCLSFLFHEWSKL